MGTKQCAVVVFWRRGGGGGLGQHVADLIMRHLSLGKTTMSNKNHAEGAAKNGQKYSFAKQCDCDHISVASSSTVITLALQAVRLQKSAAAQAEAQITSWVC